MANRIKKSDHSLNLRVLVPEISISNAVLCPVTCSSGVSKEGGFSDIRYDYRVPEAG